MGQPLTLQRCSFKGQVQIDCCARGLPLTMKKALLSLMPLSDFFHFFVRFIRIAAILAASPLAIVSVDASSAEPLASFENDVRPLLEEYCFRCHGENKQKGDVQLSSFHSKRMMIEEHELWREVIHQIKSEEMPDEEPLPSPQERALLVDWLEQTLNEIDWAKVKNPGHVTMPRLTKTEYNNTMRDLLGVDIRPGDYFSEDGEGLSGFNNDRDSLFVTPVLMEKYFEAAERSIDGLLGFKKEPIEFHFESEAMFMTETRETPKQFGDDFLGYVLNRGQMTLYDSIEFPHDGIYEFKVRALSTGGPAGARLRINDEVKGDIEVLSEQAGFYEIAVFVSKGEQQVAWNIEKPPVYYKPKSKTEKSDSNLKAQSVAIDWIEVRGPVRPKNASAEPLVFVAQPGDGVSESEAAGTILRHFVPRALRRPVSENEIDRYAALYQEAKASGQSFEESMKLALAATLVSPHFLYRPEMAPSGSGKSYRIDNYELASRLSYFLWMSMPDDELFQLAKSKRLSKPRTLRKQVDRMLKDPRASVTMETFLGQWLGFESLGKSVIPDRKAFPKFTPALGKAMKEETFLVFDSLLRNEGSLLELLDSNSTFLNEVLANHYEIDGVSGNEMRRVALDNPDRGGLLGMGSVLTATSSPMRTSPVNRGKWVLETLLGNRIPEPPADAGILPENAGQKKGQTLREEFEMHRNNPSCMDCHKKIDPIGFGLENFDAIGHFRTTENGEPIDTSGVMPGGVSFTGSAELKSYILNERVDQFTRNVSERMLAFALGRELKHYDEAAIIKIIDALEKDGYSAKTLIEEVVLSYPFRYQHPNPENE